MKVRKRDIINLLPPLVPLWDDVHVNLLPFSSPPSMYLCRLRLLPLMTFLTNAPKILFYALLPSSRMFPSSVCHCVQPLSSDSRSSNITSLYSVYLQMLSNALHQIENTHRYLIHDETLRAVPVATRLGIDTSNNLSWNPHINKIVNKASLDSLKKTYKVYSPVHQGLCLSESGPSTPRVLLPGVGTIYHSKYQLSRGATIPGSKECGP